MNMMGTTRRVTPGKRESATDPGLVLAGIAITVLAVVSIVLVSSVHLSGADNAPVNPAALTLSIAQDKTPWTGVMTAIAAAETLLLVGLAAGGLWLYVRRSDLDARDFDRAAPLMGHGRQIRFLTEHGARAKAKVLSVPAAFGPGLLLGRAVAGGKWLYSNWETCTVDIWGPRRGKTLSRIIPGILTAPGPVLATSNKYDYMVKATRAFRRRLGRIWLFDLQKIANHNPDFWWNPLTYITDDETAEQAVAILAVDAVPTGGGGGSAEFFHKAASRLLKCLLLAASLDRKPAPIVATWTAIPTDASEAAEILDRHGWPRLANEVRAAVASPSDQRGGVFETALNWASVFTMSTIQAWITDPGDGRPHFDPHAFVRSKDTAYIPGVKGRAAPPARSPRCSPWQCARPPNSSPPNKVDVYKCRWSANSMRPATWCAGPPWLTNTPTTARKESCSRRCSSPGPRASRPSAKRAGQPYGTQQESRSTAAASKTPTPSTTSPS